MKITTTLSSYEVSAILDCMDTKIKALNHVLDSKNLDSDLSDSCISEIKLCKNLVLKLSLEVPLTPH
jgi:hypothetical protein